MIDHFLSARSPIRSLHVVSSLRLSAGGPTQSVTQLCDALNRMGGIAEIATVQSRDAIQWTGTTPIRSFPGRFPDRLCRSPELATFLKGCARQFDVIHVHGLWQWPGLYARKAAIAGRVPMVISPRGMLEPWTLEQGVLQKRIGWVLWEKMNLRSAVMFHATSQQEALNLRKLGFHQPIAVLPNAQEFPTGESVKSNLRRLLYLSRLHEKKGINELINTWSEINQDYPDWELILAGPIDSNNAECIMKKLETLPRSKFLGPVYGDEKWRLLRSSDLLILPSYSENFGNVVAEALSQGVPVLTTRGTPWSVLETLGAGWWINISDCKDSIRVALGHSRAELAAMGERGRKWIREFLNPEQMATQMLECYTWLRNPSSSEPSALIYAKN